ncbi:hypothetical protein LV84_03441 [Algoriphagus ratkowskyi]|uniref:Uncharacterized protein n=1 Tax=Algoriphagus ratkowskyi TaxID=57028 RepID=A0A2W7RNU8_9BACT|nr:hypothetical protein [Algoriphagus ratkowskyi]PZX52435.1 hypothetical protein LV84_03441 [Algoriphagus ratkowskyi]TXD76216.1 hypothetical protein ESW18_17455 [Algoriphagus ratkowskyi]
MKRTQRNLLILAVLLIVFSNLISGYINVFTRGLFPTYHYQTANAEFEFTAMPSKGRDVEMMEHHFQTFKNNNPKSEEQQVFRTFKRNPLQFWNWYSYMTNDIYTYKYQHPNSKGKLVIN